MRKKPEGRIERSLIDGTFWTKTNLVHACQFLYIRQATNSKTTNQNSELRLGSTGIFVAHHQPTESEFTNISRDN
jgi:hypothetical protein